MRERERESDVVEDKEELLIFLYHKFILNPVEEL